MHSVRSSKGVTKRVEQSVSSIGTADDLVATGSLTSGRLSRQGSIDSKSRKSVRFRDEFNGEENDVLSEMGERASFGPTNETLVDIAYYETLMQDKEPWGDHTYLAGFRDIFSADEIWLADTTCVPCRLDSTYQIQNKEGRRIFYVTKRQDWWMTWAKAVCLWPFTFCRSGFVVKILGLDRTLLVKFIRRTHFFARQLDIVETFYGKDCAYVGRIERSSHGYLLRDKDHEDIYRVLESPPSRSSLTKVSSSRTNYAKEFQPTCCSGIQKELRIFRTDTKEVVGRLYVIQKGFLLRFFSGCRHQPNVGFSCNSDVGTNAKILLIGTLFFLMHSDKDKFVNLPLGNDAFGFDNSTSALESETSLDKITEENKSKIVR